VKIRRQEWIALFLLLGVLVIFALPSFGLFPIPPTLRAARFAAQILIAMIGAATFLLGLLAPALYGRALVVELDRCPVPDPLMLNCASRC
jgi:hypothetical protein